MSDIEKVAKIIYELMRKHPLEGINYPWVEGGNSFAQDEARSAAHKIMETIVPTCELGCDKSTGCLADSHGYPSECLNLRVRRTLGTTPRDTVELNECDAARYRWLMADSKRRDRIWEHVLWDTERGDHRSLEAAIDHGISTSKLDPYRNAHLYTVDHESTNAD